MEQPTYVRRLIEQKYVLAVGVLVALIAGFFAGFAIVDGEVVSRATKTFTASSKVLLTAPSPELYQVEIPEETETIPLDADGNPTEQELIIRPATPLDLSNSAIILAYLASSDQIADAVEAEIGPLGDGESIVAVRRTTQPNGDERFGGRLELPIVEIAGVAESADRAQLISASATDAFEQMVLSEQRELGIAEDIRLVLEELNGPVAVEVEGSNPLIPVVVVGFGVFLVFIAAALIVGAVRDKLRERRAGMAVEDEAEGETDVTSDADEAAVSTEDGEGDPDSVTAADEGDPDLDPASEDDSDDGEGDPDLDPASEDDSDDGAHKPSKARKTTRV
ncbi:hypothetical protein [uncultured Demequina sp.]|uniref:hypothetical protein n=1 Tax=uncultured Demequina sp. TaxID=693499 RepID=UPI0025E8B2BE|nr:hypothetical protein [uncultured Demequina sp.]